MKKILLLISSTIFVSIIFAADTTTIRIHDHTDMTWYGNYDEWGVLPDSSLEYRKIYLHYTMGCATGGCSDWDYTSQIIIRHRTGETDSILNTLPNFTVNSIILDTAYFSYNPVYIYSWNSITNNVDSLLCDSLQIIQFNDVLNPSTATDTIWVWQSNLEVYSYDSLGVITDTTFFLADTSWILEPYTFYTPYNVIENFELARVITPYGSGLANNWEFTHTFDITDFAQILRDSVEIRCHYSGWSSGFSATLDFEFIEGIPPRKVIKTDNIYSGGYNYINSTDFEANKLVPKKFLIESNSTSALVKMAASGHAFDNTTNAAEFNPINYYLNINGNLTHTQYNWDEKCGENPIFPQGGTWIYDRANWCPGQRTQAFNHEITPYINSGDSVEVNINFDSFTWGPHSGICPVQGGVCYNGGLGQTPLYTIECQLFQFSDPNFDNSAEIIDIIKPSLKDAHSRKNPICSKPLIKIRNYGINPLTSLDIEYKVIGGSTHTYSWTGNLAFLETEEVELPNLINWSGTDNIFEVILKNPNGEVDDYNDNNFMQSEFEDVPEYPSTFALWVGTNGGVINTFTQESETVWEIFDENGATIFTSGSLYSNTQYRDTLTFDAGCYNFIMTDSDEDGLDFWANNDGGGMIRFREIGGSWIKTFNADFGTNIIHQFSIGQTQNAISNERKNNWTIFPNPTENNIIIEGLADKKTSIILTDNLARIIKQKNIMKTGIIKEKINLSSLENGIYFIQIQNNQNIITQKVVKL